MIKKIQSSEYLKRIDNMNVSEREAYLKRVGEWLNEQAPMLVPKMERPEARFQNVIQCSAAWNDAECEALQEGAKLLSALVGKTETWLPELFYTKAAKRCLKLLVASLQGVMSRVDNATDGTGDPAAQPQGTERQETGATGKPLPMIVTKGKHYDPVTNTVTVDCGVIPAPGAIPMRPKHIDDYVHLLPKGTQERAAQVRGLLRDLDVARENAKKLVDAGEQGTSVAGWAKRATELDKTVRSIYDELDAEWEKLVKTGRVTVDALGRAIVVPEAQQVKGEWLKVKDGENREPLTVNREPKKPKADKPQKMDLDQLKTWLRETRYGNRDREAFQKLWSERYQELVKRFGEGEVTDSIRRAAEHYGINLEELKPKAKRGRKKAQESHESQESQESRELHESPKP